MEIIYLLIPIALLLSFVALAAFIWAVRTEQMDDLETPAVRILFEDEDLSPSRSDTIIPTQRSSSPDQQK